ncbi:hypothetical protein RKD19_003049 [Streptomyces canus]
MARVGEGAAAGHRVVDGVHAGRQVHLGQVSLTRSAGRAGGLLDSAGGTEPTRDLVQRAEHLGRFEVQQGQGPDGGAQFAHRHRRPQSAAHHVTDHQRRAVSRQFDDVEPVASDLAGAVRGGVAGQVAAGDVQSGGDRVAGRQQGPLQYQRPLVLAPVQAGVVDTDRRPRRQLHREVPVPVPEGLAALGPGELCESHDGVVGDHRHREGGLHEAALLGRDVLRARGAQGVRAGRVEGVVVDRADRDGGAGAGEGGVGDRAGEGDPAQFGTAVGEPGRGLVARQQPLVEVDGGQVAEAGHDDVEEFAGRGLQVERVPYAGAGLVQQGEIAPCGGCLTGGGAAGGDVGSQPGDADGPAGAAAHPVQVDGPVAALVGARQKARDVHVRDGVAGLQDPAQGRGDPLGLGTGQVVVDALAAVVVRAAAEEGGETVVDAADPQLGVDQHESEGRLTENRLRGGEVGLDAPQCAHIDDDADGGLLTLLGPRRHDVDLGEPLPAALALVRRLLRGHPEGNHTGPLAAVQDLRHLALALRAQVLVDEGLDGVHADGVLGGDAEELLGPQAPLVDQTVGAYGEGRDLDVVVDRAGRAALPHGVGGRRLVGTDLCHGITHGLRPRAARRVLRLRGLRWYLAHANRPLQLTASGTGHRGRLPAVSSTTAPHNTVFTITARSRRFSVRTATTLPVF